MKAEEIIKKHWLSTEGYSEANWEAFKQFKFYGSVISAMEEYAAQQAPEPVEELRNVLYKFRDLWCQNIDISTIDEFLKEYKSQQP